MGFSATNGSLDYIPSTLWSEAIPEKKAERLEEPEVREARRKTEVCCSYRTIALMNSAAAVVACLRPEGD